MVLRTANAVRCPKGSEKTTSLPDPLSNAGGTFPDLGRSQVTWRALGVTRADHPPGKVGLQVDSESAKLPEVVYSAGISGYPSFLFILIVKFFRDG